MKQADLNAKKTFKHVFLEQLEQVVPWTALVVPTAAYYPEGKTVTALKSTNWQSKSWV
jgi:hypothetical protein